MFSEPCIKQRLFGPDRWYQCTTIQAQLNWDGTNKELISCHAGWRGRVYLRRVTNWQNVDVRQIRDVLDVALVRKLDYHTQNFVNVVECVIEHKVVLCCPQTPRLHCSFLFSFLCLLLRFGFVIFAPKMRFIDYLLKEFNLTKKESAGPEKKCI